MILTVSNCSYTKAKATKRQEKKRKGMIYAIAMLTTACCANSDYCQSIAKITFHTCINTYK